MKNKKALLLAALLSTLAMVGCKKKEEGIRGNKDAENVEQAQPEKKEKKEKVKKKKTNKKDKAKAKKEAKEEYDEYNDFTTNEDREENNTNNNNNENSNNDNDIEDEENNTISNEITEENDTDTDEEKDKAEDEEVEKTKKKTKKSKKEKKTDKKKEVSMPTEEQFKKFFADSYLTEENLAEQIKTKAQGKATLVVFGNESTEDLRHNAQLMQDVAVGQKVNFAFLHLDDITQETNLTKLYKINKEGQAILFLDNGFPLQIKAEQLQELQNKGINATITENDYKYPMLVFDKTPTAEELDAILEYLPTK